MIYRTLECSILEKNTWLVCESPARIDLSGGWSDTPPVCYENGGSVLNVSLLIGKDDCMSAVVSKLLFTQLSS